MIEIPFSPNHAKNSESASGDAYPCVVCGKAVRSKSHKVVRMVFGTHLVRTNEPIEAEADMGLYPIGPDCLRRHPELKEYLW